jgi:hypothetical protein
MPDVTHVIPRNVLERIDVPEDYLGAADTLRVRLLESAATSRRSRLAQP